MTQEDDWPDGFAPPSVTDAGPFPSGPLHGPASAPTPAHQLEGELGELLLRVLLGKPGETPAALKHIAEGMVGYGLFPDVPAAPDAINQTLRELDAGMGAKDHAARQARFLATKLLLAADWLDRQGHERLKKKLRANVERAWIGYHGRGTKDDATAVFLMAAVRTGLRFIEDGRPLPEAARLAKLAFFLYNPALATALSDEQFAEAVEGFPKYKGPKARRWPTILAMLATIGIHTSVGALAKAWKRHNAVR